MSDLSKKSPEKSLIAPLSKTGGRNVNGRITTRHIGGGHKRRYRIIDFKRTKDAIPARVSSIEYDPNRSARIALLVYADGEKRYILAAAALKEGDTVENGPEADIRPGNCLPIKNIPLGTIIHNVELQVGQGGKLGRSAGTAIQLMAKEGDYAQLRLPSGEMRLVRIECRASIGPLSNGEHDVISVGKAGRKRHMGRRPTVRGTVMNPVDHPHGGGEGKSKGHLPTTPWGIPTIGYRTRKAKPSDRLIVRRRKK